MGKHTPGPWLASLNPMGCDVGETAWIVEEPDSMVTVARLGPHAYSDREACEAMAADARLIAAAPALMAFYEAVRGTRWPNGSPEESARRFVEAYFARPANAP